MTFFKDNPFCVPERSELIKPLPRFYKGYRKLSLFCKASTAALAKALPPELAVDGDLIEVFVMECPEVHDVSNPVMGPRRYLEGGIVVQARYGDLRGGHVLYEFVTTDDSMAGGREVWGYPKKLGEVSMQESESGAIEATVSRLGRTLIDIRFKPDAAVKFDKPVLHPRIQVKRIPRADGAGYDVHQIIRNELKNPNLRQSVRGTGAAYLGGSVHMDPLFELGVSEVIGGEFVVADFHLDYGSIHEDLLAKERNAVSA